MNISLCLQKKGNCRLKCVADAASSSVCLFFPRLKASATLKNVCPVSVYHMYIINFTKEASQLETCLFYCQRSSVKVGSVWLVAVPPLRATPNGKTSGSDEPLTSMVTNAKRTALFLNRGNTGIFTILSTLWGVHIASRTKAGTSYRPG